VLRDYLLVAAPLLVVKLTELMLAA